MPLEDYRRKRDFAKTPEPPDSAATVAAGTQGRFVVQRHRATRLHYDVRLEIDGVLVSWAVPRGPTLDPGQRRMAIHVEDHPIEYLDFEGVIPARQYGAGDVIVWDWGTFEPEPETPDPAAAIRDGELKLRFIGEKLAGRFTIVRTSGRPRKADRARGAVDAAPTRAFEGEDGEQWLLIKKRDASAVAGWDAEDHPRSVKTGRTNDEVRADRDAYWLSAAPAPVAAIDLSAAERAGPPRFLEPMLATLADRPFDDPDWLFEVKWDGYRVEAVVRDGSVRIYTRNGHDASMYFPDLVPPPGAWLAADEAILDGEVVALDAEGRPDFSLLQARISRATGGRVPGRRGRGGSGGGGPGRGGPGRGGSAPEGGDATLAADAADAAADEDAARAPLVYQVFDLLHHDGRSLLRVPLEDRKRLLRAVLRDSGRVRFAGHVVGDGMAFHRAAAQQGLEGIVAKHRRSRYEPGRRSTAWLKLKLRPAQELVVGGWTAGEGSARSLGAIVVGVMDEGRLRYAGKVGSGFDERTRRRLRERLDALATETCPFDPDPGPRPDLRGVRWVEPRLVVRAELGGWSRDGLVRQAAFKGIEEDRDPGSVVRETAIASASVEAAARDLAGPTAGGGPSKPGRTRRPGPAGPAPEWAAATPEELARLDDLGREGRWAVGGQELRLTNLDKVLFPGRPRADAGPGGDAAASLPEEPPVTKRDLVRYFGQVAPAILPHLAERPLNLQRFPDGIERPGFWQKDLRSTDPRWLRRWREVGAGSRREANEHLVADRTATLCWLGNQAAFEIHAWTARLEAPFTPTFALIDIDPGERTTWDETLVLARLFRTALEHLGVRGYPKTTGKRGLQVWIPIEPRYTYEDTSGWVEGLSRAVGAIVPDLVSWEWSKDSRGGRARLDYTQNSPIRTLVAPYAVRPAPGAPVSAPIRWEELDDPALRPDSWTVRTIGSRVDEVGDLFAGAQTDPQPLPSLS
jgi:bifunctional non-homologous end joining protein LigD